MTLWAGRFLLYNEQAVEQFSRIKAQKILNGILVGEGVWEEAISSEQSPVAPIPSKNHR